MKKIMIITSILALLISMIACEVKPEPKPVEYVTVKYTYYNNAGLGNLEARYLNENSVWIKLPENPGTITVEYPNGYIRYTYEYTMSVPRGFHYKMEMIPWAAQSGCTYRIQIYVNGEVLATKQATYPTFTMSLEGDIP